MDSDSSSNTKTKMSSIEQQLTDAENTCSILKNSLDYLKGLYNNQSESDDSKLFMDTSLTSPISTYLTNPDDTEDDDNKYYQILQDIKSLNESSTYENDVANDDPRTSVVSSIQDLKFENAYEKSVTSLHKCHITRSSASSITMSEKNDLMVCREQESEQCTEPSIFQKLPSVASSVKLLIDEHQRQNEEKIILSTRTESKKIELSTKVTESYESVQTQTCKRLKKVAKTSSVKTDKSYVPVTKPKKKKCHLRNANSKSTVTTNKDSNVTDKRRSIKRRKPKSSTAMLPNVRTLHARESNMSKADPKHHSSDIFEIYNNQDTKSGTLSFTSSKHSKVAFSLHDVENRESVIKDQQKLTDDKTMQNRRNFKDALEVVGNAMPAKPVCKEMVCSAKPLSCKEICKVQTCKKESLPSVVNNKAPSTKAESVIQSKPSASNTFDPFLARNYEMPTVASKLKQVQRSYFSRFNIRNIPFVVGTSVTPSHNLGLNIQQVLSIMKTSHPIPGGMHNLFIQKVGKGVEPVTSFLEKLNYQYSMERFPQNGNQTDANMENMNGHYEENGSRAVVKCNREYQKPTYVSSRTTYEPLYEEEECRPGVQWISTGKSAHACSVPRTAGSDKKSLPVTSSIHTAVNDLKLTSTNHTLVPNSRMVDLNIEDSSLYRNQPLTIVGSEKSKEIHSVFIRLHNQFEDMNTRYVKMQNDLERRKIRTPPKEFLDLEADLEAKGEEIRAVVNLYSEVMALKQQMKSLNESKSFVCIATEETCRQAAQSFPIIQQQTPSRWSNINGRKKITYGSREPSAATRLVGLLRQIQAFQKQLSS